MRRERDASIRSTKRCTLVVHPLIISMTLTAALKDVNRARQISVSQALVTFIAEQILEALRCCQCRSRRTLPCQFSFLRSSTQPLQRGRMGVWLARFDALSCMTVLTRPLRP